MVTSRYRTKPFILILSFIILLQSCTTYKTRPSSLEELVEQRVRAKVKTKNEGTQKFRYIIAEDGRFYGVKRVKGEHTNTLLNKSDIIGAYPKRKPNIALSILGVAIGTGLLIHLNETMSLEY